MIYQKKYLPSLNGLRFFAALCVVITHIELIKGYYSLPNIWQNQNIKELGSLGVIFFFVLSGFLITYLMQEEKKLKGSFSLKNFYLRRVFRILPLYYLVVFLGFVLVFNWDLIKISSQFETANENYWSYLLMYLFLIPNFTLGAFNSSFPHIGQLWSIGVEEHFYLVWPFVFIFSKRNLLKSMVLFFITVLVIKTSVWLYFRFSENDVSTVIFWSKTLATEKLECMSIGGIFSFFFFNHEKQVKSFFSSSLITLISVLFIFIGINFTPPILQDGMHVVYSFLFVFIIANSMSNSILIKLFEFKFFNYLGQISFGIYVYHLIIVTAVISILSEFNLDSISFNLLAYLFSLLFTFFVSYLSYNYFERYFLKLKSNFS